MLGNCVATIIPGVHIHFLLTKSSKGKSKLSLLMVPASTGRRTTYKDVIHDTFMCMKSQIHVRIGNLRDLLTLISFIVVYVVDRTLGVPPASNGAAICMISFTMRGRQEHQYAREEQISELQVLNA
jgi:hypothetical protein